MVNRLGKLINLKHGKVWSIKPNASVCQALELMAEKDIGFLVVMEANKIVGALSERDYARKIRRAGQLSDKTLVSEIMSKAVYTLTTQSTFEEAMALMSSKRIRHIPILEEGKVLGVISMRDVVQAFMGNQKETIQFLEEMALDR
jgi:CBS domain-containing protein